MSKGKISKSVIKRLPRYYRFLNELEEQNIERISSNKLAEIMRVTASQVRQDLNCFGGFGHQGYGYSVPKLKEEIENILGLNNRYNAVLIGAGHLGSALAAHMKFEKLGFNLIGIFDNNDRITGNYIGDVMIQDDKNLESFCKENKPQVAVLCTPTESAKELADRLISLGIDKFWNFTNYDLLVHHPEILVENVHIKDSLMALSYRANNSSERK